MKQTTLQAFLRAYVQLEQTADELYVAADAAIENNDFDDASLLASRADKIYQEVENLDVLLSELEEQ
jgi:phage shock protein A